MIQIFVNYYLKINKHEVHFLYIFHNYFIYIIKIFQISKMEIPNLLNNFE